MPVWDWKIRVKGVKVFTLIISHPEDTDRARLGLPYGTYFLCARLVSGGAEYVFAKLDSTHLGRENLAVGKYMLTKSAVINSHKRSMWDEWMFKHVCVCAQKWKPCGHSRSSKTAKATLMLFDGIRG